MVGYWLSADLAAADVVRRHGVQEPGGKPAAAEGAVAGDAGEHGRLHGQQAGQRRVLTYSDGRPLAVDPQGVSRVPL